LDDVETTTVAGTAPSPVDDDDDAAAEDEADAAAPAGRGDALGDAEDGDRDCGWRGGSATFSATVVVVVVVVVVGERGESDRGEIDLPAAAADAGESRDAGLYCCGCCCGYCCCCCCC
jgi:hypothetical protein